MRLTDITNHGAYSPVSTQDTNNRGQYELSSPTTSGSTCETQPNGSEESLQMCSDRPDLVLSPGDEKSWRLRLNGDIVTNPADAQRSNLPTRQPSDASESCLRFNPNTREGEKGQGDATVTTINTFSSAFGKALNRIAKRGRMYANRQQRRLMFKNGECNISKNQIMKRKRYYMRDLFTTLLEMKWRYNLLLFGCAFITSWLVFAFLWWIICVAHGDHLDYEDEERTRCIANVHSFPTAFLYSIETQHTIGYGYRVIEDKCLEAFLLLMIQSCFGVFIQSLLTGVIFAKLSRPKRRAKTMMFSKNAVICQRDGELFLLFRVGDMRKSPIIQTSIRSVMVKSRYTKEGELIPLCQYPLELETETSTQASENFILLSWPITVVHRINDTSPLWEVSAEQLLQEQFEIVVILEGTIESTGMLAQMRTSYLPGEILWGHRFRPLFAFWKDKGQYQVDFTQFDETIPIETPECSAKDLYEQRTKVKSSDRVPYHKESLFMSNFLTVSSTPTASKIEDLPSPNPSIFKRMRSSLKRRRSERDRRRNGSLPSISFNENSTPNNMRECDITDAQPDSRGNSKEREVDVNFSIESFKSDIDMEEE